METRVRQAQAHDDLAGEAAGGLVSMRGDNATTSPSYELEQCITHFAMKSSASSQAAEASYGAVLLEKDVRER
jgi:hypothetical protein